MPAKSRAHYGGSYPLRRRRMLLAIAAGNVRAAYIEAPDLFPGDIATATEVLCWRCAQPLEACGPNRNGRHRNGRRAKWTAGHTVAGDSSRPIVPECSPCNYSEGASHGNQARTGRIGFFGRTSPPVGGRAFRMTKFPGRGPTPRPSLSLPLRDVVDR